MSILNPLGQLAHRDAPKPTLRERAAALKSTAARLMRRRPAGIVTNPTFAITNFARDQLAVGVASPLSNGDEEPHAAFAPVLLSDPIFAAIKAHQAARSAFEAAARQTDKVAVTRRGGDTSPEAMAVADETWERTNAAEIRAWNNLFIVPPTTQAGLVALIFHARPWVREQYGNDLVSTEDVFTALARGVRALPVPTSAAVAGIGRGVGVSPALADLFGRHRAGLACLAELPDSTDDETLEAVDVAAWDLAHEAFTLPIAGPADLREKLKVAAPEIDEALDAAGHSMASHAWNCIRADLLGGTIPWPVAPAPDAVHDVIAESRRLLALNEAVPDGLAGLPEDKASSAACRALFAHWKGVVLKTTPTTLGGCVALVRYVIEFMDAHEGEEDELVAAMRLLADGLAAAEA